MNEQRIRLGLWSPLLYGAGGVESWFQTLCEHIDTTRIELVGLAVADKDEYMPYRADMLRPYCPVTVSPEACTALAERVDVLVTWGLPDISGMLPRPGERPTVVMVSHADKSNRWLSDCCRRADVDVDVYVAVSEAAKGPIPVTRFRDTIVIPNGVDTSRLVPKIGRAEQLRAWGLPSDAKVLGYLGRMSEEKDPRALARAVRHLPEPWFGVAIGDGWEMGHVRADAFVQAPGRVYFPGMSQDVGSVLGAFDVLLVPSRQEGFGLSIVEGVMAGRPVVCTEVGWATQHQEYVFTIAVDAGGEEIAAKVLEAADFDRGADADGMLAFFADRCRATFSAKIFARRWSNFIVDLGNRWQKPVDDTARRSLAASVCWRSSFIEFTGIA